MELIKEVVQVYIERRDWFAQLILEHIALSATARRHRAFYRNVDLGA